jgi:seryl-tRNA synthetase
MHDIRFIRENPEAFDRGLARRGLEPQAQRLIALDEKRRAAIQEVEAAQARRNAASKEIGDAKKAKNEERAKGLLIEVAALKETIPALEAEEKRVTEELNNALAEIPNLPQDDVPDGKDASDNVERHHFGAKRNYAFTPKQHFDLGEALGQMDFETAAKLSGARFVVLKKGLARLERALGQFMLDVHTSEPHNYIEVAPPLLVRDEVMFGTAQLPKFKDDQFASISLQLFSEEEAEKLSQRVKSEIFHNYVNAEYGWPMPTAKDISPDMILKFYEDNKEIVTAFQFKTVLNAFGREFAQQALRQASEYRRWLIPTAEVPLTNLIRESIVDEAQLPLRFTACTPCFRAEAGAAGKDTRGMIRQHQFTKVELVSITTPEQSKDEHERMLSCAEEVLKRLELHYRVMALSTGDMGFPSQKTYDIEVWLPGQGAYREISSCSNCGEFQARRMNARYRPRRLISGGGMPAAAMPGRAMLNQPPVRAPVRHVHTLNGSGVAVGRALIAVMETYQQEDGSIAVPEALAPYMGGIKKIEKQ